jgi:hypothetical protein
MPRAVRWLLALLAVVAVAGCYCVSSYRGDGELVDYGWRSYSRRYVLDLGPVNLSSSGSYSYTLRKLPKAEFTIGIEITELQRNDLLGDRPDHSGHVRLELKAEDGEAIILEDGPLDTWTWSHGGLDAKSFLYRRGEQRDIPLPGGGAQIELLRNANGGWGSYFIAANSKVYSLRFDITKPNPLKRDARLVLYGVNTQ